MILADKIIKERKRLGLSQEELAEKMNVSRQAVSKWEGNQSIPEIEKILQLSSLFGVTTDYLLKDEIETAEYPPKSGFNGGQGEAAENENAPAFVPEKGDKTPKVPFDSADTSPSKGVRRITVSDAEGYLSWRRRAARNIAVGIIMCILSFSFLFSFPLLFVVGRSSTAEEQETVSMDTVSWDSEANEPEEVTNASFLGVILGFLLFSGTLVAVGIAVGLLAYTGSKNAPYKFIETGSFETEAGVTETVRERQRNFHSTYVVLNILGAITCVISTVPILAGAWLNVGLNVYRALVLTVIIAGIGAGLFIFAGVRHASMQKLLKEGKYSEEGRKNSGITLIISVIYWVTVLAAYILTILFGGESWEKSGFWKIWIVALVLFPAVLLICYIIENKHYKT